MLWMDTTVRYKSDIILCMKLLTMNVSMTPLQESLNELKKKQENCQRVLTTSSKHNAKRIAIKNASSQLKFSQDTERLGQINAIRNGPVGAQIKHVIDLLYEKRIALTAEQINEECYVDINSNEDVFNSLRNNPKVRYDEDDKRFSYKPKHDIKNKDELLELIRELADGIKIVDLKDAYTTVMEDLRSLQDAEQVWILSNSSNSQEDVAYPNDPRVAIKVDKDIKELYGGSIVVPRDMIDIERELRKNGMKPATDTAKRRAMAKLDAKAPEPKPEKKKGGITKRTKLTNAHLPELFMN